MSGLVNPSELPEESAYALVIELIRAQRVPIYPDGNITGLLSLYDEAVQHFKKDGEEKR